MRVEGLEQGDKAAPLLRVSVGKNAAKVPHRFQSVLRNRPGEPPPLCHVMAILNLPSDWSNRSCVAGKIWLGAKGKISLERAALRFKYESCFESFGMLY